MVKKIVGYGLIAIGLFGYYYFESYKGKIIPLPFVWMCLSILLFITGAILLVFDKTRKKVQEHTDQKAKHRHLKNTGEKILVDLDHCEFKTTYIDAGFQSKQFSGMNALDALYGSKEDEQEVKTVTYIIFKNGNQRFVSQAFPMEETMLKYYISNNNVLIYINRFDRTEYVFDLEKGI